MRNIFYILLKYRAFLIFSFLQLICLSLLIQYNAFHRASFLNSTNSFIGSLHEINNNIQNYFNLKEENERLLSENALLRSRVPESFIAVSDAVVSINDSLYHQHYTYIPAAVVSSSAKKGQNFILINKGKKNGIQLDMGVINDQGVVGYIVAVSDHFSKVMPVIHPDFRETVMHTKNHEFGPLNWTENDDPSSATVHHIPVHKNFNKGDLFVTRQDSKRFPAGISVGTVQDIIKEEGESFQRVRLKLGADFFNLHHIYVIQNKLKQEQIEISQEAP